MKSLDILKLFLLVVPGLVGYASSYFCTIGNSAGITVKLRPPGWVFGVVWPILFLLIGISWYRKSDTVYNNVLFLGITIVLAFWTIVYGCLNSKKGGLIVIILSLILVVFTTVVTKEYLLIPLILWLSFATYLNIAEIIAVGKKIDPIKDLKWTWLQNTKNIKNVDNAKSLPGAVLYSVKNGKTKLEYDIFTTKIEGKKFFVLVK